MPRAGFSRSWQSDNCSGHNIAKERSHLGGKSLELLAAPLIRTDDVEGQVAHTGVVERADLGGDVLWRADGAVTLGCRAHVHRIAHAERTRGFFERLLVAVANAGEDQVRGAEAIELASGLLCGRFDGG